MTQAKDLSKKPSKAECVTFDNMQNSQQKVLQLCMLAPEQGPPSWKSREKITPLGFNLMRSHALYRAA